MTFKSIALLCNKIINKSNPTTMAAESMHQKLNELQGNMMNLALMLTSDYNDARALVQDTMLMAQNGEMHQVDHSEFKDWVFATMKSIFHSNYSDRQATLIDTTGPLYDWIATDSVEIPLEGVFSAHPVALEISKFTDAYRLPYSLYLSGYHIDEIAARSHSTARRVKSILLRAQYRLLRRLSV